MLLYFRLPPEDSDGYKDARLAVHAFQTNARGASVECGHHRGVCHRTIQSLDNIANVAFATRPENLHQVKLKAAE